jgi:Zn-dependent protease with chaperone function
LSLALVQLVLLATLLFGAAGSLTTALVYPQVRDRILRRPAADRVGLVLTWITLPLLLALTLTVACVLPSLLQLVFREVVDHCVTHPDHHVHLCLIHQPAGGGSALAWSALALLAAVGLRAVMRAARALRSAHRAIEPLLARAETDGELRIGWIRCPLPMALTVGLLRPRVLISDALREQLPEKLLEAVIAHERAHERRRDVAKRALASVLARLHTPATRRLLLEDLVVATELAADAEAARAVGSSLRVADAILAVEHLTAGVRPNQLALAFGEASVGARIEALLAPAITPRRRHRVAWVAGTLSIVTVLALPLHHAVETLLTSLVK